MAWRGMAWHGTARESSKYEMASKTRVAGVATFCLDFGGVAEVEVAEGQSIG